MVYKLQLKNNNQNFNSREQFYIILYYFIFKKYRTDYFDFREYYAFQTMNQGNKV